MVEYACEQEEIEKKEYETLQKLNFIFKDSLELFDNRLKDSLKYINYITLPIIMASIENKSFNPFAEIIEKHISFIVNNKMASIGYKLLPLGYASDLAFEDDNTIVHIDIKTANINNPADFKEEIALGINQTSYAAKLPSGVKGKTDYNSDGIDTVKIYSNLPEIYVLNNLNKLTITNGLLFIYPDYKEFIDDIRKDYIEIRKILDGTLLNMFKDVFSNDENIIEFLDYKPDRERFKRRDLIVENLVRAYFIHNKKELKLEIQDQRNMELFAKRIIEISKKLSEREIKPVAIISISIPNGKLSPNYDTQIVSGKAFGNSIRYHYEDGVFKSLDGNKSRVIFIYLNNKYIQTLKSYFKNIVIYDVQEKKIKD